MKKAFEKLITDLYGEGWILDKVDVVRGKAHLRLQWAGYNSNFRIYIKINVYPTDKLKKILRGKQWDGILPVIYKPLVKRFEAIGYKTVKRIDRTLCGCNECYYKPNKCTTTFNLMQYKKVGKHLFVIKYEL